MAKYCQQQFKAGWSEVGGKRYYFRSGLEVRWARYLQILKELGEIRDWFYEFKKFEFEGIRSGTVFYTPDFYVSMELVGGSIWHEVKGHIQQRDCTKFRRMQKYYPDEKMILVIQRITKKNKLLVDRCRKYVAGVIEAEKLLKKNGM